MYRQKQKRLVKHNVSSTCRHNMVNLGQLTAEIGWRVWSTPANFNGFCILASLLHRRCSMEVNQTLHDVLAAPALVHYVYILGAFVPLTEFCQVQNSLCVQVLRSPILAALLHGIRSTAFNRGRHLAIFGGRPSRWAWAHILVCIEFQSLLHSSMSCF